MKVFFAFMVFLLAFAIRSTAQEDPTVTWYENLFVINKKLSVEEALQQMEDRRQEAFEMQNKKDEIKVLIELGVFHLTRLNNYEHAMNWLIESLTLEDSLNLRSEKTFSLLAIARVFEEVGDYYKSADFLQQALEINHADDNLNIHTLILHELGRINALLDDTEGAYNNYERVLEYAQQLQLPARQADALFHIGQLQSKKKEYKKSLTTHRNALAIRRLQNEKEKEARSLNEIGVLYSLMGNPNRAIANHVAAMELQQAMKDDAGLARSYNHLGILYFEKKDYKQAIKELNLGLQAGREAQAQEQIRISFDYLSQCYKELKDYKKALEFKESFLAIEEFIQNEKHERQLLETQNRYTITKKEAEINQLELNRMQREKVIETQHKLRNFLILIIVFGLIIGLLVLYLYYLNRKSNRKLLEINETKDKLFSIIGHDLKGPLNSLSSFVSLLHNHTDSLSKEEIKMLSLDLDKSLKNLFALLENLLEWARSQTGNIDFKAEPFDLSVVVKENEVLLKGQLQNKGLTIRNETTGDIWVNAHRNSINTVVRNLLSNAIKFTSTSGTITISAAPMGKHWRITVADTGVGMSDEVIQKLFKVGSKHSTLGTAQEKGTGLGLVLCHDFVEKNGGTLGVESEVGVGSRFYFTVPTR